MCNRFHPKDPAITYRKQLSSISQNPNESLEEWAERCQQVASNALGEISPAVAQVSAVEAFLSRALDKDASYLVMQKDFQDVYEALFALKKAIHTKNILCSASLGHQSESHSVIFSSDPVSVTEVVNTSHVSKLETELKCLRSKVSKIFELLTQSPQWELPSKGI